MMNWCYFIPVDGYVAGQGYRVSIVKRDESGHSPTGTISNNPVEHKEPWFWGNTYEEANELCREMNEKIGIGEEEALKIVAHSMFKA